MSEGLSGDEYDDETNEEVTENIEKCAELLTFECVFVVGMEYGLSLKQQFAMLRLREGVVPPFKKRVYWHIIAFYILISGIYV